MINLTALRMNSAENNLLTVFLFSQKTGSDISCNLSTIETIYMRFQILISGQKKKKKKKKKKKEEKKKKKEKYLNMSSAENFTQGAKR